MELTQNEASKGNQPQSESMTTQDISNSFPELNIKEASENQDGTTSIIISVKPEQDLRSQILAFKKQSQDQNPDDDQPLTMDYLM